MRLLKYALHRKKEFAPQTSDEKDSKVCLKDLPPLMMYPFSLSYKVLVIFYLKFKACFRFPKTLRPER